MKFNEKALGDITIELPAKYLYAGLALLLQGSSPAIRINADELAIFLGITKGRIYRARSLLTKHGLIKHNGVYHEKTGKKISDEYELLG